MSLADRLETLRQLRTHPANAGARWRAVGDYLRWNFGYRALPDCAHVLPLIGDARIILSGQQNYATLAYVNRLWDFADMAFLLHFLRPQDRFGDLGANVGGYTILAARCVGAQVLAAEPVPQSFAGLGDNIRLNDIASHVDAHQVALGAEAGTVRMTAQLGGMNHVATSNFRGATVEVPIVPLDALPASRGLNLIKLDAEGYELNIIQGGRTIFGDPGLHGIIVELNASGGRYGNSDDAVDAALRGFGFLPHSYDPTLRRLAPLPAYNRVDFNTIYVRPSPFLTDRLATAPEFLFRGRRF